MCSTAPASFSAAHEPVQQRTTAPCIGVVGARGGHGASTVAAVIALTLAEQLPVTLVADELDHAAALLGIPAADGPIQMGSGSLVLAPGPQAPAGAVVADRSYPITSSPPEGRGGTLLAVLRGPCYLGLRSLLAQDRAPDGIVLLAEPGRALTDRDVADATGIAVVATVPVTAIVPRAVDAGLLLARHRSLREFRSLRRWLAGHLASLGNTVGRHQLCCTSPPQDSGTDLPLALKRKWLTERLLLFSGPARPT